MIKSDKDMSQEIKRVRHTQCKRIIRTLVGLQTAEREREREL